MRTSGHSNVINEIQRRRFSRGTDRRRLVVTSSAVIAWLIVLGACSTASYDELAVGDCVRANDRQVAFGLFERIDCDEFEVSNVEHWRIKAVGDLGEVQARCPTLFDGIVIKDEDNYAVCLGK